MNKQLIIVNSDCFTGKNQGFSVPDTREPLSSFTPEFVDTICGRRKNFYKEGSSDEPQRDLIVLARVPLTDENIQQTYTHDELFAHEFGHIVRANVDLSASNEFLYNTFVRLQVLLAEEGKTMADYVREDGSLPSFVSRYAYEGYAANPAAINKTLDDLESVRKKLPYSTEEGSVALRREEGFLQDFLHFAVTQEESSELFRHLVYSGTQHPDPIVQKKLDMVDRDLRKPLK